LYERDHQHVTVSKLYYWQLLDPVFRMLHTACQRRPLAAKVLV